MSKKIECVHCSNTRLVYEGLCRDHYLETVYTGEPLPVELLEPLFFNPWAARHHGLSRDRHRTIFLASGGLCGVCKSVRPDVIDHDHECCEGQKGCRLCVRGLLCSSCNIMLGQAGDSVQKLKEWVQTKVAYREGVYENAIEYLERYSALRAAGKIVGGV